MKVRTVSKNARVCGTQNDLHNYLGHPTRAKLRPDLKLIISENILYMYVCITYHMCIPSIYINQIYHALRSSSEIMDSEVTGIALFFEERSPEKNSAIPVTEESIILAGTSKRVHGIFDLYPTIKEKKTIQ